jgi:hypothetical protein
MTSESIAGMVGMTNRFAGCAHPDAVNASVPPSRGPGCQKGKTMKRFILLTVLLAAVAGAFAAITPASADPHGDRMKRDCASGARKC